LPGQGQHGVLLPGLAFLEHLGDFLCLLAGGGASAAG
jgi:hypothetical protein